MFFVWLWFIECRSSSALLTPFVTECKPETQIPSVTERENPNTYGARQMLFLMSETGFTVDSFSLFGTAACSRKTRRGNRTDADLQHFSSRVLLTACGEPSGSPHLRAETHRVDSEASEGGSGRLNRKSSISIFNGGSDTPESR